MTPFLKIQKIKDITIKYRNKFIILVLLTGILSAQTSDADSISILLATQKDTTLVNSLNELSTFLADSHPEDAKRYSRQAAKLSKKLNFDRGKLISFHNLGAYYYTQSVYDSALYFFRQSLLLAEEEEMRFDAGKNLNNIGMIHLNTNNYDSAQFYFQRALGNYEQGNFVKNIADLKNNISIVLSYQGKEGEALKLLLEAASTYEELNLDELLANCLNNISSLYIGLRDYDNALIYANRAIQNSRTLDEQKYLAESFINMGIVFGSKDSNETAINYYKEALAIKKDLRDQSGVAQILLNIGNVYQGMLQYQEAIKHYEKSYAISISENSRFGQWLNLVNMARIYRAMGDFAEALNAYHTALALADEMDFRTEMRWLYEGLYNVYKEIGKPDSALLYHEQYMVVNDSLLNEAKQSKILELQTKYDVAQKEKDIISLKNTVLEKEIARNNVENVSLITIIILLIISATFWGRKRLADNHRKIAEQEKVLAEKENEITHHKLDASRRELIAKATYIQQKNDLIGTLKNEIEYRVSLLKNTDDKKQFKPLLKSVDYTKYSESNWREFEQQFTTVYKGFFKTLSTSFPSLTPQDLKYCAYLKMNMNTKEIAKLTGLSVRSVETRRYRLRKKLNISKEKTITAFLNEINL